METVFLDPARPFSRRRALAQSSALFQAQRRVVNGLSLVAAEVAALAAVLLIAGYVRQWVTGDAANVVGFSWVVVPLYVAAAWSWGVVPGWGHGAVEELRRVVLSLVTVFTVTALGLFFFDLNSIGGPQTSRLTLGAAGVLALGLVPMARWSVKSILVSRDVWGVPAVIYGAGQAGARIVRQLQEERGCGYTPVAVFSDAPGDWGGYLDAIPIVGDLGRVAPEAAVAFLALPDEHRSRQIELLEGPLSCYRTVVIVPDLFGAPSLWVTPRDFAGVLGLELSSTLTRLMPRLLKRLSDLVTVVALAPFWVPLVAILSIWVWLSDRGSPFYGQERIGADGRTFQALKLRTMVPDADAALEQALAADPALRDEWDEQFKLEDDPRITAVGRLLRRTSLDELPQLVNVLRGEMSLVGPRPLPAYHHDELSDSVRALRERVKPGITGLWQVSGRSAAGNIGMERWDPYYVRNWSPWLDAVILVRTARVVIQGSGAY